MSHGLAWSKALKSAWVFPTAIVWKLGLIGAARLPPPANDAYFFDGAVINWLLHGAYVNPSIGRMFPTSATEFFSAYPPGYQAALAAWMSVFGPTVEASLWLHGVLFSIHALLVLAILVRAGASPLAMNLGGCFLFALTFHDRPDSVAHVLGVLAFWWWTTPDTARAAGRRALATVAIVSALATSLHIGAMYSAMLWGYAALRARSTGWPWRSMTAMAVVPIALATLVVVKFPTAWQGFQENLLVTPSFTGLRLPAMDEILKVVRNTPGLLVVTGFLLVAAVRRQSLFRADAPPAAVLVFVPLLAAADFAVFANLCIVHPNYVLVATYPQIAVVALWVWLRPPLPETSGGFFRFVRQAALPMAALLVSFRALALTTWGVACAADVSKPAAVAEVRRVIDALPQGVDVLVSSAYLYDLADVQRVNKIHSDWIGRYGEGVGAAYPRCFVLTPFDYYRRYRGELAALAARGHVKIVAVEQSRRWPVPDEFPRFQRVVQHLSWAPVIVRVEWR